MLPQDYNAKPFYLEPAPTTTAQFQQIQLQQWLQHPQTILALSQLKKLHINQLRQSSQIASNAAHNDLTLRLHLTKAAVLETLIDRITKGELSETNLL